MKLEKQAFIRNIEVFRRCEDYNDVKLYIELRDSLIDKELEEIEKAYRSIGIFNITLEKPEPILDEAERKYLSGVIRPFRDSVKDIVKRKSYDSEYEEYIIIHCGKFEAIVFPYFKEGTMYKNMVINKEYSLEDLNL